MITSSKCTLNIDLKIIKENYNILRLMCPNAEIGAAVKANCYGLGVERISHLLKDLSCKHFFVANLEEGVNLRDILGFDINIYVLNGVFLDETKIFREYNLVPILNHLAQIKIWQDFARKTGNLLPSVIHFDTGMNRLGMPSFESDMLTSDDTKGLNILCVMSHLVASEEPHSPHNKIQLEKFIRLAKKFPLAKKRLANSSGIYLNSDYHFDIIRPGGALYGINPRPYNNDSMIKNPISLYAPIIQIHRLLPSESAGYNATHTNLTENNCIIATIPIGYADGIFRSLGNKLNVYINEYSVPVIGRISMDLAIIDVSLVPAKHLFLGQKVEILGPRCSPDEMAMLAGTNTYEILTRLGDRFERIYT